MHYDRIRRKHVSNKRLYEESQIIKLDKYLIQSSRRCLQNLTNHPNPIIGRIMNQPRHPNQRYLEAKELLDEDLISTNDEENIPFYADPGSAHYRG